MRREGAGQEMDTPLVLPSHFRDRWKVFNQPRVAALMQECHRRTFGCAARWSCARVKLKTAPLGFIGGSGGGFGGVTVVLQHPGQLSQCPPPVSEVPASRR